MAQNPARAEPVRAFADDRTYASKVIDTLKKDRDTKAAGLVDGIAIDYADYKGRVGEIRGLDTAIRLMTQEIEQA